MGCGRKLMPSVAEPMEGSLRLRTLVGTNRWPASRRLGGGWRRLAEREGFEPPGPFGPAVFKTAAIDHSATSPESEHPTI